MQVRTRVVWSWCFRLDHIFLVFIFLFHLCFKGLLYYVIRKLWWDFSGMLIFVVFGMKISCYSSTAWCLAMILVQSSVCLVVSQWYLAPWVASWTLVISLYLVVAQWYLPLSCFMNTGYITLKWCERIFKRVGWKNFNRQLFWCELWRWNSKIWDVWMRSSL